MRAPPENTGDPSPIMGRHTVITSDKHVLEWVTRFGPGLYRFATGWVHDTGRAEDIVQEVFIRAWRHPHPERITAAWLFHVTRRLCIDAFRQAQREERKLARLQHERPDRFATQFDTASLQSMEVQQVLRTMTPKDRLSLWLFYYAEWSLKDIATELKTTPDAVKVRLYRARNRFRHLWEEDPQ